MAPALLRSVLPAIRSFLSTYFVPRLRVDKSQIGPYANNIVFVEVNRGSVNLYFQLLSTSKILILTAKGVWRTTSPASYFVTSHLRTKLLEYSRGPSASSPVESMFWLKAFFVSSSLRPLSLALRVKSASTSRPSVWPNLVNSLKCAARRGQAHRPPGRSSPHQSMRCLPWGSMLLR